MGGGLLQRREPRDQRVVVVGGGGTSEASFPRWDGTGGQDGSELTPSVSFGFSDHTLLTEKETLLGDLFSERAQLGPLSQSLGVRTKGPPAVAGGAMFPSRATLRGWRWMVLCECSEFGENKGPLFPRWRRR